MKNIFIKNNIVAYPEFKYKVSLICLKNPFLFILTSLNKASKAFEVQNKDQFRLITGWSDLSKIPKYWVKAKKHFYEYKQEEKIINTNTILENQ